MSTKMIIAKTINNKEESYKVWYIPKITTKIKDCKINCIFKNIIR